MAWNALIFGVLLYVADEWGRRTKAMEDITFAAAMAIGVAQALALIPGTSRSGITMTAARFLGFERAEAARFSFLLGIPAITGAGILTVAEIESSGQGLPPGAVTAAVFTFFSALAAIAFLMALVKRLSFTPFVMYRMLLAGFLLVLNGQAPGPAESSAETDGAATSEQLSGVVAAMIRRIASLLAACVNGALSTSRPHRSSTRASRSAASAMA